MFYFHLFVYMFVSFGIDPVIPLTVKRRRSLSKSHALLDRLIRTLAAMLTNFCMSCIYKIYDGTCKEQVRKHNNNNRQSALCWGSICICMCVLFVFVYHLNCISLICKVYYEACENQSGRGEAEQEESRCVEAG